MGYTKAKETASQNSHEPHQEQHQPNINSGSGQAGQQVGEAFLNNFQPAVTAMSNGIVEYVTVEALKDAMQRLARGEISPIAKNMLKNYVAGATQSLDCKVLEAQAWEEAPKALPPSSQDLQTS